MKRYIIEHPETVAEEHPLGLWVKYEPWMDGMEKLLNALKGSRTATQTIELLGLRNLEQQIGNEYASNYPSAEGTQGPTICVKCKHMNQIYTIPAYWNGCKPEHFCQDKMDFVIGDSQDRMVMLVDCYTKNRGNCPDFEPKEVNQ